MREVTIEEQAENVNNPQFGDDRLGLRLLGVWGGWSVSVAETVNDQVCPRMRNRSATKMRIAAKTKTR